MAHPLTDLLGRISEKSEEISNIFTRLNDRIRNLEEENSNLRRELDETRAQLSKALTDAEFLTVSHRLADSPDSIIRTRRQISRLIRTIDNCISMLKEE